MILIADSGSTKTHWCLLTASGQRSEFKTEGINPFFLTQEQIRQNVSDQLLPQMGQLLWVGSVRRIFFYGAGCTPEKSPLVGEALKAVFRHAEVEVYSDMMGAARALLQHSEGVACILGTGSNSCLYDGEKFVKNVPALGFILGDEGSGAVLGKRLVADLLKNQLPEELKEQFLKEYNLTQAEIIDRVYRQPFPNRFLASLSKFCADHIDNVMIHELVYYHFEDFVKRILKQYPSVPVGFVGSIAYYYKDILEKVLRNNYVQLATIVQSPMEGLIEYHREDAQPTM